MPELPRFYPQKLVIWNKVPLLASGSRHLLASLILVYLLTCSLPKCDNPITVCYNYNSFYKPCLSFQHQPSVIQAVEQAKNITMADLHNMINVSIITSITNTSTYTCMHTYYTLYVFNYLLYHLPLKAQRVHSQTYNPRIQFMLIVIPPLNPN